VPEPEDDDPVAAFFRVQVGVVIPEYAGIKIVAQRAEEAGAGPW
jgi:hypothetical protein